MRDIHAVGHVGDFVRMIALSTLGLTTIHND
jgi:hypothetical protein